MSTGGMPTFLLTIRLPPWVNIRNHTYRCLHLCRTLGYSPSQVQLRHWQMQIDPRDPNAVPKNLTVQWFAYKRYMTFFINALRQRFPVLCERLMLWEMLYSPDAGLYCHVYFETNLKPTDVLSDCRTLWFIQIYERLVTRYQWTPSETTYGALTHDLTLDVVWDPLTSVELCVQFLDVNAPVSYIARYLVIANHPPSKCISDCQIPFVAFTDTSSLLTERNKRVLTRHNKREPGTPRVLFCPFCPHCRQDNRVEEVSVDLSCQE